MLSRLIYAPEYDFGVLGLERLHPFDARKFSKAWQHLRAKFGEMLSGKTTLVDRAVNDVELSLVHTHAYLQSLSASANIAKVVEVAPLKYLPAQVLCKGLVTPARYAVRGTLTAAREALEGATVFNLGGGFHHAFADHGEGFCFFADAALAIEMMRHEARLRPGDSVIMIDLDVHRGNGFFSFYEDDSTVGMFDLYNMQIYPGLKDDPDDRFPFVIPMRSGLGSKAYLDLLMTELPRFLEAYSTPKLAFYNAGTDILSTDKLGSLDVDFAAVMQRDRYVVDALRQRNIPVVIMSSGGYSADSYRLIVELATHVLGLDTASPATALKTSTL